MLPLSLVGVMAALFGNVPPGRFPFFREAHHPDFSKICPGSASISGARFFPWKAYTNLGKSILKVVIIGFVSWIVVNGELEKMRNS
jgi:flagellar biosynthesis protein FlhB